MYNTGIWLSDPPKEIELKEIKTNNMIYVCREQMYADAFVKGKITKKNMKHF